MAKRIGKKYIVTPDFLEAIKVYLNKTGIEKWKLAAHNSVHPSILSRAINQKKLWPAEADLCKRVAKQIQYEGVCFNEIAPAVKQ